MPTDINKTRAGSAFNKGMLKKDDIVTPGPDTLEMWEFTNPDTGQKEQKLWLRGDAKKAEAEGWVKVSGENEQEKVDKGIEEQEQHQAEEDKKREERLAKEAKEKAEKERKEREAREKEDKK